MLFYPRSLYKVFFKINSEVFMKKLLMILALSFIMVSCGDPDSYSMTRQEFIEAYGDDAKKILQDETRKGFAELLKSEKSKEEIKEEVQERMSDAIEDLTGLTMEEFNKVKENWNIIKQEAPEGYQEMTIKQILDYESK
jgi:hypothetical protein